MTVKEAKAVLKEMGLSYEIETTNQDLDLENAVILDQLPKKGISILEGTKIILYLN